MTKKFILNEELLVEEDLSSVEDPIIPDKNGDWKTFRDALAVALAAKGEANTANDSFWKIYCNTQWGSGSTPAGRATEWLETNKTLAEDKAIILRPILNLVSSEIKTLGYTPATNRFILFIANLLDDSKNLSDAISNKYSAVHNAAVKGYVTNQMLSAYNPENILYCPILYTKSPDEIINYLKYQSTILKVTAGGLSSIATSILEAAKLNTTPKPQVLVCKGLISQPEADKATFEEVSKRFDSENFNSTFGKGSLARKALNSLIVKIPKNFSDCTEFTTEEQIQIFIDLISKGKKLTDEKKSVKQDDPLINKVIKELVDGDKTKGYLVINYIKEFFTGDQRATLETVCKKMGINTISTDVLTSTQANLHKLFKNSEIPYRTALSLATAIAKACKVELS